MLKDLQNLIQFFQYNNFKSENPNYNGKIDLSETALIDAEHFTAEVKILLKERKQFNREHNEKLKSKLEKMSQNIENTIQRVNIRFNLKRLAPALKGVNFDKNYCRSLLDTIDYFIFKGFNKTERLQKKYFTDINMGDVKLKKTLDKGYYE